MKTGRPTLNDQKEIYEILFYFYENNIEAYTASKKSGINYKTVLNYYKKWDSEIIKKRDKNFLRRIKTTKEKCIRSLDDDIISLSELIKKIESQIKHSLTTGNLVEFEKLSKLKLKTMEQRTKTQSAKINLIGTPTADYAIHQSEMQNDV